MAAADKGHAESSVDLVASNANARLLQKQWKDYLTRFQPVADKVIEQMGKGPYTTFGAENIAKAGELSDQAFNSAQAAKTRDLQRYGQGLSDVQAKASSNDFQLAGSASKANAMNTARQSDIDLRDKVVSGGLGSVGSAASPING